MINMCGCEAHRSLVDCTCGCDHSGDRIMQWKARALAAEERLATVRTIYADEFGDDQIDAYDRWVRAEALREAAEKVRGLAVAGEDDGNPWTPGDANTEVYNEAIRDAWDAIRARADAEAGSDG